MDQIGKYLNLINTVAVNQATASVNTAPGGALAVAAGVDSVDLSAGDGKLEGLSFQQLKFGLEDVIPPTPTDPSIRLKPVLSHMVLKLSAPFFARLAEVIKEPLAGRAHELFDTVILDNLRLGVKLTAKKVLELEVKLEKVRLLRGDEECVVVKDVLVRLYDFDLNNPNKKAALADTMVVIHGLRVEVAEKFLARALAVGKSKAPDVVQELTVELPGKKMVVGGAVKVGLSLSFRVDLRLETKHNLFGIYFDRFYVPGTNIPLPGFSRNLLLGLIRAFEKKAKGLLEVTNESLMINPWPKVPCQVECKVEQFGVEEGRIVVVFGDVPGRAAPPEEGEEVKPKRVVLPPGPPL
ncbi:MAG: hypothetical protein KC910_11300 [Candidatus Eremiobacteraeota bacterium]|nr:hypothetical protein [Candidatus Eremiobacteraeota bacterium]